MVSAHRGLASTIILVPALMAASLVLAAPVLADCSEDEDACVQLDALKGVPGARIPMTIVATCGVIEFSGPGGNATANVKSDPNGDEGRGFIRVPDLPAGSYSLALTCPDGSRTDLGLTFRVIVPPDTATAPRSGPDDPTAWLVLAAALGFAATFRRGRPAAASRGTAC